MNIIKKVKRAFSLHDSEKAHSSVHGAIWAVPLNELLNTGGGALQSKNATFDVPSKQTAYLLRDESANLAMPI